MMSNRRKPRRQVPPPRRPPVGPGRTIATLVALFAALALGIGIQVVRSDSGVAWAPRGAVDRFGLAAGPATAPVTVDVYLDYLCPACRRFEATAGDLLRERARRGDLRVIYRPIAILDGYSTTQYSTRAGNAAACAADTGRFLPMQRQLFENQPPEGSAGLPDSALIELGRRSGISSGDFGQCIRDQSHVGWVTRATDVASQDNVFRTPTVKVNGTEISAPTVDALVSALRAAGVD